MRKSIKKQEKVVQTLWNFAHDLQTKKHETVSLTMDGKTKTTMNLDAIEKAIEEIMGTFGYKVTEVQ